MEYAFTIMLQMLLGFFIGGLIGCVFGLMQSRAQRRYEKLQAGGQLQSGWRLLPGSGGRVVYLMLALILVQVLCPVFFVDGAQWWVSAGVVCGYAYPLFRQMWQLRKARDL